jgi:hypothetical protein
VYEWVDAVEPPKLPDQKIYKGEKQKPAPIKPGKITINPEKKKKPEKEEVVEENIEKTPRYVKKKGPSVKSALIKRLRAELKACKAKERECQRHIRSLNGRRKTTRKKK